MIDGLLCSTPSLAALPVPRTSSVMLPPSALTAGPGAGVVAVPSKSPGGVLAAAQVALQVLKPGVDETDVSNPVVQQSMLNALQQMFLVRARQLLFIIGLRTQRCAACSQRKLPVGFMWAPRDVGHVARYTYLLLASMTALVGICPDPTTQCCP